MFVFPSRFRCWLLAVTAPLLWLTTPNVGLLSLRGQEQGWNVEEPGGPTSLLEFTATEGTWTSVDVSPDGQNLVFDLLGHLYEMSVEGGEARRLTDGRSWNLVPRYSPDGSLIAFNSDRSGSHDVWVLERSTGELTRISHSEQNVFRPSWSADGRRIYATAPEGIVAYGLHGEAVPLVARGGVATT